MFMRWRAKSEQYMKSTHNHRKVLENLRAFIFLLVYVLVSASHYHCPTFATTRHSCEPLESTGIIYESPNIVDTGTLIMIPIPSSDSHNKRIIAAKKSLRVLTSVKMGLTVLTAALKLQYVLTVTIIWGHVGSNLLLLLCTLVYFRKLSN